MAGKKGGLRFTILACPDGNMHLALSLGWALDGVDKKIERQTNHSEGIHKRLSVNMMKP